MKKAKVFIKLFLYDLMRFKPFKMLQKIADRDLLVINYHSILGIDPDPFINENVYRTAEEFERDIIFLKKHYCFVTVRDILNHFNSGIALPKNSVFLTFDDGLKVVYDEFRPILLRHKVNASFFLNPLFIDNNDLHFQRKKNLISQSVGLDEIMKTKDKWKKIFSEYGIESSDFQEALKGVNYKVSGLLNSLADIFNIDFKEYLRKNKIYLSTAHVDQMIDEGFAFGGHSMDHPKYDELCMEEQIEQTLDSIKWVKERFNLDYSIFAFPLRDHKVSHSFFKKTKTSFDLSFGVMGIGDDIIKNHIQRIDVESTHADIDKVLKLEYVKYLIRKCLGKKQFKRPL